MRLQSKNFPNNFIGVNPQNEVFIVNKGKRFELVSPGLTGEEGMLITSLHNHDNS